MRMLLVVILMLALTPSALAHDPNRPDLNGWFDALQSGKGPCCSKTDGKILADADWESRNGHYRVRIPDLGGNPEWVDVPDDAVIKTPNLDGRTMVWPLAGYMGVSVRCFMPGPMT